MDDQTEAILGVMLESIGELQRQLSDNERSVDSVEPEFVRLCDAVNRALPPGNDAIWSDMHRWLIYEWAQVQTRDGSTAANRWLTFSEHVRAVLPPPIPGLRYREDE
jgi:hypothetical protein